MAAGSTSNRRFAASPTRGSAFGICCRTRRPTSNSRFRFGACQTRYGVVLDPVVLDQAEVSPDSKLSENTLPPSTIV